MAAISQPCDAGVIRCTLTSAPRRPSSRPWVIAAASLGSGIAFLDSTVVNVALPAVQVDLKVGARVAQWVYGAYALVLATLLLIGGSLGDRYGRRRVFVLGAAVFAASAWCAFAPGPEQLVAARAVQGAGGALLVPASLAIVGASFEGKLRAKAIGAWSAFSGTAMAVGPVLGGWLVEEVSWRAAFLIAPTLAIVAILIALRHVPESRDPGAHRLDLVGAILAATGLAGLVYGLIESSASGFGDPAVLAALIVGAVALFAFVERRGEDPMVPPTVALGSVGGEHSGLASGVNNAVTRMAGLLAVAALGVVVYGAFSANLDARLEGMDLPGGVRSELEAAKADLGAAEAPEGVGAETAARIERAIDESFVAGFRAVMLVCAGFALASALAAALFVGDRRMVRSASRGPNPSDWRRAHGAGVT